MDTINEILRNVQRECQIRERHENEIRDTVQMILHKSNTKYMSQNERNKIETRAINRLVSDYKSEEKTEILIQKHVIRLYEEKIEDLVKKYELSVALIQSQRKSIREYATRGHIRN